MNKKLKLALAALLGFSTACSTVKNAPAKGAEEQKQETGSQEVQGENGKEIFVHFSGIVTDGFKSLNEGQAVEFEVGSGAKGDQAVNVTVIE